jgi:hypothetical protein
VEVDIITDVGLFRASVPSGASTGVYEVDILYRNHKYLMSTETVVSFDKI